MRKIGKTLAAALALIALAAPLAAHHSFSAFFDPSKRLTFKGVVTKIDWSNPHIYVYVDVQNDQGKVVNWAFQVAGPIALQRRGWSRDTLHPGDHVTMLAYPARGGVNVAAAREVVMDDGRKYLTGCTYDGGPLL